MGVQERVFPGLGGPDPCELRPAFAARPAVIPDLNRDDEGRCAPALYLVLDRRVTQAGPMAMSISAMMCSASLLNPGRVENGRCTYRSGRLSQYAKRQSGQVFSRKKNRSPSIDMPQAAAARFSRGRPARSTANTISFSASADSGISGERTVAFFRMPRWTRPIFRAHVPSMCEPR